MNKHDAIAFLKLLGISPALEQHRTGWLVSRCPLGPWNHDKGKSSPEVFGIRIDNPAEGDSFCNCFACGFHGPQSKLVLEMQLQNKMQPQGHYDFMTALQLIAKAEEGITLNLSHPDIEEVLFTKKKTLHVYPDWWLSTFSPWRTQQWAIDYLKIGRPGCDPVPDAVADMLDIRVDTKEKRVCFPVRDFSGTLRGFHGRTVLPDVEPRYRMYPQAKQTNPIIWLGEHWVDTSKPIIVVEGPFDIASVMRLYRNVVSPLFATPSFDKLMRMADCLEWFTLFDRGVAGDNGRKRAEQMTHNIVKHILLPQHLKDPGATRLPDLEQLLSAFVPLDPALT